MNVCLVGSRSLKVDGDVALHVLAALQAIPGGTVLLRKPLWRPPRSFETLVSTLAASLGLEVRWCVPAPGGRSLVFLRDVEMVQAADEVIAFFPEGEEMTGGTAHVVEKALDQKRPVRAYAIQAGAIRLVGSEDWSTEGGS